MCVIYLAIDQHPDYPLILLANRDEYYARPSLATAFWDDFPEIYAGRDMVGGGTWLGVTRSGRFSAVTNYRDPKAPAGIVSRGELVAEYLKSDEKPDDYLKRLMQDSSRYSGFNLIAGEMSTRRKRIFYCSNRTDGVVELDTGVYGLSNHLLDTPWPKVRLGKERLNALLVAGTLSDDEFFRLLADTTPAEDADLPSTGIPIDVEKAISSVFIRTPNYGTRCSTLIKFDSDLAWTFEERLALPVTIRPTAKPIPNGHIRTMS